MPPRSGLAVTKSAILPLGSAMRPVEILDHPAAEGPVFLAPDSAVTSAEVDIGVPHVPPVALRQLAVKMTAKMLHEPGPRGLPVLEGRAFYDYRSAFEATPRKKNTKTGSVVMKFARVGLKSAPTVDAGTDVAVRVEESGLMEVSSARDGKDRLDEAVAVMLLKATLNCMRRCGFNVALAPDGLAVREVCCVAKFPRAIQVELLAPIENIKVEKKQATLLKLVQKNASMKIFSSGDVFVSGPDFDTCCRVLHSGLSRVEGCLVFTDPPSAGANGKKRALAAAKTSTGKSAPTPVVAPADFPAQPFTVDGEPVAKRARAVRAPRKSLTHSEFASTADLAELDDAAYGLLSAATPVDDDTQWSVVEEDMQLLPQSGR